MKKATFIALLLVAAILAFVGVAVANEGPHGDYTAITDACAGCHRAHTASGPRLLVGGPTISDFCLVCHGSSTTGADTNVTDGWYMDRNTGETPNAAQGYLLGGGFETISATVSTSRHDVNVSSWGMSFTAAYGITETGVMGDLGFTFECSSCHDPHGNDNYRILRNNVVAGTSVISTTDELAKSYTAENYGAGLTRFCAQCHPAYHVTAPGAGSAAGPGGKFRHRMDMAYNWDGNTNPDTPGWSGYNLPLYDGDAVENGSTDPDSFVTCLTCHVAHGSAASMSGFATGTGFGVPFAYNDGGTDSFLLRLNDRGVCEVCHQK